MRNHGIRRLAASGTRRGLLLLLLALSLALAAAALAVPPLVVALAGVAALYFVFLYLMHRRRSTRNLPQLDFDPRSAAEEEDDRSTRLDALLDSALRTGGIHVFFGGTSLILVLYLLAPRYGGGDPLEAVQYVVAALGPLLTVASIYFVVRQLRRNEEAVWATTVEQVHARMHDIHRIFLDKPELRGYFYGGVPAPDPAHNDAELATRASVMAEMVCDYFEQVTWHSRHLPTAQARAGWRIFMTRMFEDSPIMRRHMRANRSMYPDELVRIAGVAEPGPVAVLVDEPESHWLSKGHAELEREFGPTGGMESLDQLRSRLCPVRERSRDGYHVTYEMMLLVDDDNTIVGVADYCVIVPGSVGAAQRRERPTVGFLSHLWIATPRLRRSLTVRILARLEALLGCDGQDAAGARALVTAVDPLGPDDGEGECEGVCQAEDFSRLGYTPAPGVAYLQPDFNTDGGGGASLPLPRQLMVRRLGRAAEGELTGAQLRHIADSLYAMYARSLDNRHIAAVRATLDGSPAPDQVVRRAASQACVRSTVAGPRPSSTGG